MFEQVPTEIVMQEGSGAEQLPFFDRKYNLRDRIKLKGIDMADEESRLDEIEYRKSTVDSDAYIFQQFDNYPVFTPEEESETVRRMKYGETEEIRRQARNDMVLHNMRLAVKIAKKYMNLSPSLSLADLTQAGMIGLMNACEKFDPEQGFRFTTYAAPWIRQAVVREIEDSGRTIRLPAYVSESLNKIRQYVSEYEKKHGGVLPGEEDAASALNIDKRYVRMYMSSELDTASLDSHVGSSENGDSGLLGDFIPDSIDVEEEAVGRRFSEEMKKYMKSILSEQQYTIICRRFGFDGEDVKTQEEIGREMGISREKVKIIETSAVNVLRRPKNRIFFEHLI